MTATGLRLLRRVATDDLVKIAALTARRGFLEEQRKAALVEFVEPLVPGDLLERIFAAVTGKIYAQNAYVVGASSPLDAGWPGPALFRPTADLVMICGHPTCC